MSQTPAKSLRDKRSTHTATVEETRAASARSAPRVARERTKKRPQPSAVDGEKKAKRARKLQQTELVADGAITAPESAAPQGRKRKPRLTTRGAQPLQEQSREPTAETQGSPDAAARPDGLAAEGGNELPPSAADADHTPPEPAPADPADSAEEPALAHDEAAASADEGGVERVLSELDARAEMLSGSASLVDEPEPSHPAFSGVVLEAAAAERELRDARRARERAAARGGEVVELPEDPEAQELTEWVTEAVEEAAEGDDLGAVMAELCRLERQGARSFDADGCDCVRALVVRGRGLPERASRLIAARGRDHLARLRMRFDAARAVAHEVLEAAEELHGSLPSERAALGRGELAVVRHAVRRLGSGQSLHELARSERRRRASEYKSALSDFVAARALARAADGVPENAGPYNPLRIASDLLSRISSVSPIYLTSQLNRLEELASMLSLPELPEPPSKPAQPKAPPSRKGRRALKG
ncbi:MAG: DUF2894 domain-containing protein [Polyangiales bacterium]